MTQFFSRADGTRLAYEYLGGEGATIVFLPGYMSDMQGSKALALWEWAKANGKSMLRLDYSGCGESDGKFADGTIEMWRDDALYLINAMTTGPILLVGSSMGGWIALLIALALPERLSGLVGIAAAPDFTRWGFTEDQKQELRANGQLVEHSEYSDEPYITTLNFWQSGERNLLLADEIAIAAPVRLLHGQSDPDVPWKIALDLASAVQTDDVRIHLIKDGDHRLSRDHDIALLIDVVDEFFRP